MIDRIRTPVYHGRCPVMAASLLWLLVGALSAAAGEPYREFLDGLRVRGYHDTALAYLEWLQSRGDLPEATVVTLGYERAVTFEMAAADAATPLEKAELLDRAVAQLEDFSQQHPAHPLATTARFRLGAVLVTRAQLLTEQIRVQGASPARDEHAVRARSMYDEAGEIYASLQQWVRERLLAMPAHLDPVADAGLINERDRLRSRYVEVQLLKTGILQKKADTHATGSPDYLDVLRSAASEYHTIFSKYSSRLAGLYARLYEGRCYQQTGDLDGALAIYKELLELEAKATPFVDLRTNALKAAFECWLDESRKDYATAELNGEAWLNAAERVQLENATAVTVIENLAVAHRLLADRPASDATAAAEHRLRAGELERLAAELQRALSPADTSAPPKSEVVVPADER